MNPKSHFKVGDKAILHNREVTISKIEWQGEPEYQWQGEPEYQWQGEPEYQCFMYSIRNDPFTKITGANHRYHEGMFRALAACKFK